MAKGDVFPADSSMMNGNQNGALTGQPTVPENVVPRHSVLLSAEEATEILAALEGHEFSAFVNDDSVRTRLTRASEGREAPEPGTDAHFE